MTSLVLPIGAETHPLRDVITACQLMTNLQLMYSVPELIKHYLIFVIMCVECVWNTMECVAVNLHVSR